MCADHAAVKKLAEQILADFSRVDILVNNAGLTRDGLSMRMSEADWDVVRRYEPQGRVQLHPGRRCARC